MRIDVLTIFPEYLAPLELSLVGKARRDGIVDIAVHDLREWTTDRHRSVDDTPAGGGAGMVMRPDIWGLALDDVLARTEASGGGAATGHRMLMIPTPSGTPLTQRMVERLAEMDHIVVACGRYEGIDGRVAEYYRAQSVTTAQRSGSDISGGRRREAGASEGNVEVLEFSLGDYVLNGGEVASLVLIEGIVRLLPGVLGNPQSLVEESHGTAGLLEYPVYTRPPSWRGYEIPQDLLGGHHGRIERWRRDQALTRTVQRRPDMIEALDPATLERADREKLLALGWYAPMTQAPQPLRIEAATLADAPALAELAAATFPDACPPDMAPVDMARFIAQNLGAQNFCDHIASPHSRVLVARTRDGHLHGYTLTLLPTDETQQHADPEVRALLPAEPAAYLSKFYLSDSARSTGLASALLDALVDDVWLAGARATGDAPAGLWLGTNVGNKRARKFYQRAGFQDVGARTFWVGDQPNTDRVYWLPAPRSAPGA